MNGIVLFSSALSLFLYSVVRITVDLIELCVPCHMSIGGANDIASSYSFIYAPVSLSLSLYIYLYLSPCVCVRLYVHSTHALFSLIAAQKIDRKKCIQTLDTDERRACNVRAIMFDSKHTPRSDMLHGFSIAYGSEKRVQTCNFAEHTVPLMFQTSMVYTFV